MATTATPIQATSVTLVAVESIRDTDWARKAISGLAGLVALLALVSTLVGLFWQGGSGQFSFRTVHGETVRMFGHGIYQNDTVLQAAINRGTDAVTLILGIPLLVYALILYRRGSYRGRLLLTAVFTFFLYVYANLAFSVAFNSLYLVYVALFSACLFAFVLSFTAIDRAPLVARVQPGMPYRELANFMFVAGGTTMVVWLSDVLSALVTGQPAKHLDSYTTLVTYVLDLGIITPACIMAGALLLRRAPLGIVLAFPLLGLLVLLAPCIIAATISQAGAGVSLTPGEIIGPVAGFTLLGAVAIWLLIAVLRNISDVLPSRVSTIAD
jgi:hypothetical protein